MFALNALTFLAFLFALRGCACAPAPPRKAGSMLAAIGEGLRYTRAHGGIGPILLLQAVLAVSARPFFELLPGFAADVFGRGAPGLAMLSSSVGIGAVVAGLWLAQRGGEGRLALLVLLQLAADRALDARLRAQQLVPGSRSPAWRSTALRWWSRALAPRP